MFIIVRYGEREQALFNPQCRSMALLANIRERCLGSRDEDVELCDEQGNIKNLRSSPLKYASDLLRPRERFVLLKMQVDENGEGHIVPALFDADVITPAFQENLQSKVIEEKSNSKRGSNRRYGSPGPGGRMNGQRGAAANETPRNIRDRRNTRSSITPAKIKSKGK